MSLAAYRKSVGKTQAELARDLGLRSKGYLSHIETGGEPCPLKLALRIEDLSDGQVPALSLVDAPDAELLRRFIARACGNPTRRHSLETSTAIGGHA